MYTSGVACASPSTPQSSEKVSGGLAQRRHGTSPHRRCVSVCVCECLAAAWNRLWEFSTRNDWTYNNPIITDCADLMAMVGVIIDSIEHNRWGCNRCRHSHGLNYSLGNKKSSTSWPDCKFWGAVGEDCFLHSKQAKSHFINMECEHDKTN